MERWKGIAPVVCTAFLLSACLSYTPRSESTSPPAETVPDAASKASDQGARDRLDDLEHLIIYAERLRRLPPAGLESEHVAVRAEQGRAPEPLTRLKLALLLSSSRVTFRDYASALELLGAVAKDAAAGPIMRAVAALWLHELEERLALERLLEDERRQRQTLERKLEQLKTIEEEIDRRPTTPVVPPR